MRRVPVLEVVKFAYLFLFHEFGTIFRLVWFPLAIVALLGFAQGYLGIEAKVAAADFTYEPPSAAIFNLLVQIVSIVAFAMTAVALHRVILFNDRLPGTWLLFSLKRPERLFIGLSFLIGLVAIVAVAIPAVLAANTGASAAGILIGVTLLGIGAYLVVRLWPIYPIIVVEGRFSFREAFALSKGNFWRLVAVGTLGMLPVMIVGGVATLLFTRFYLAGVDEWAAASDDPFRSAGDALQTYLAVVSISGFLFSVVATGIGVPLICYSYKALRNIGAFEYLDENAAGRT
ncbi:hypothetical protein [Bauldia litoralis]|uniref:Membrane domain of glycerophosphoryl diester phosphodiesterase n=1 Tax=Bauldia litoralis TaxID=665467 RepID=A0A1G6AYF9_9HYPH|nr:hypothetical protein [Bauldia litoralis]SDB13408.1 hypothetical protein SAMN02982931_01007 [Bauldia litoralis]